MNELCFGNKETVSRENEFWRFYPCGAFCSRSGWKLYIPLTPFTAEKILEKITPFLFLKKIPFKHPLNKMALVKINMGGSSQIGKNIVIYMDSIRVEIIIEIIEILYSIKCKFPKIPHANSFFNGSPLYYRYGRFHSMDKDDNRFLFDKKKMDASIIKVIATKFKDHIEKENPKVQSFLLNYPVAEVIKQSGKGGVFRSLNMNSVTFEEVVLKTGYYLGGMNLDGTDGADLLSNEIDIFRRLGKIKFENFIIPELIDFLGSENSKYAVFQLINGGPGSLLLNSGRLTDRMVEKCMLSIDEMHRAGFIINDAKIGNFIWDDKGNLYLIDLELCMDKDDRRECRLSTFRYNNMSLEGMEKDHVDFLVSILYDGDHDNQSKISVEHLFKREYNSEVKKFAVQRLEKILA